MCTKYRTFNDRSIVCSMQICLGNTNKQRAGFEKKLKRWYFSARWKNIAMSSVHTHTHTPKNGNLKTISCHRCYQSCPVSGESTLFPTQSQTPPSPTALAFQTKNPFQTRGGTFHRSENGVCFQSARKA